ncbi:hypothetical protein MLD38_000043 [Melastoma candidum]|uniref:Uncharacterized protein n=1 Tax=Melastoma candidum TaxID=119954 RepID=A0ACB9SHE7_9MYRT|nr:hypothetical protein MLD38_000043 [Melastoma candidum]
MSTKSSNIASEEGEKTAGDSLSQPVSNEVPLISSFPLPLRLLLFFLVLSTSSVVYLPGPVKASSFSPPDLLHSPLPSALSGRKSQFTSSSALDQNVVPNRGKGLIFSVVCHVLNHVVKHVSRELFGACLGKSSCDSASFG